MRRSSGMTGGAGHDGIWDEKKSSETQVHFRGLIINGAYDYGSLTYIDEFTYSPSYTTTFPVSGSVTTVIYTESESLTPVS